MKHTSESNKKSTIHCTVTDSVCCPHNMIAVVLFSDAYHGDPCWHDKQCYSAMVNTQCDASGTATCTCTGKYAYEASIDECVRSE